MISFTNTHIINDRTIQFDYTQIDVNVFNIVTNEITRSNTYTKTKHNLIVNLEEEKIQSVLEEILTDLLLNDTNKNNMNYFTELIVFKFMNKNNITIVDKDDMNDRQNILLDEYNSLFYFLTALIDILNYKQKNLSVSMTVCMFNVINRVSRYNNKRINNFEKLRNVYKNMLEKHTMLYNINNDDAGNMTEDVFDDIIKKINLSVFVISKLINDINTLMFSDMVIQFKKFDFQHTKSFSKVFQKSFDFEDIRRKREIKNINARRKSREAYIKMKLKK